MFPDIDVAIVGGGPSGLISAITAAKHGHDVHLFEAKEMIGAYEHCAGLLSIDGLSKLGLSSPPQSIIQNSKIYGAFLFSPSNKELVVSKDLPHALVVNRQKFDQYLGMLAEKEGVKIHLSTRIKRINRESRDRIKLTSSSGFFLSKLAIVAEGRFPSLPQQIGLNVPAKKDIVFASQFILSNMRDLDTNFVELYLGNKYSPGFFCWVIPINENTAKVGLASKVRPVGELLTRFIKHHPLIKLRTKSAVIERRMSGAIPLSGPIKRTYSNNVLIVGDAAGHTKPTTGGGVILGGIAAKIAGEVASEAIKNENYSKRFLKKYEKLWKREFFLSIKLMRLIRLYLDSLADSYINKLFEILSSPNIKDKFRNAGHIDWQHKILFSLMLDQRFDFFILRTFPSFLYYWILHALGK